MPNKFKKHLISLLLKDNRLKDQQGELKGNVVKEFANSLDEKLIELLLENKQTKDKFFLKIKDVYVFKTNDFKFFLDENSIDNSFTQYSNQIGLATGGKFLKDNTDVVLNFPFKDCVLEGGQSTEDGLDTYFEDNGNGDYIEKQSKRKEIFFNEVLARDEIDRLLEPKAFTNITKYNSKGKSKPTAFNRNNKGTITDNLIIKGNKTQHKDKTILKNKDSILVYKKSRKIKLTPQYAEKFEWDTHYNSILYKNDKGDYTIKKLKEVLIKEGIINEKYTIKPNSINNTKFYDFIFDNKEIIFRGVNSIPKELESISLKNKDKVVFIENSDGKMFAYNGSRLSFLSKSFKVINGHQKMAQLLGDLWTDIDFQNTQNEGGVSLTNGKKPEALLKRVIDLTTDENDIVLDYHFGSGTTGAVAHKIGRQYIGLEQLDYGTNDSIIRLQNVINGDQSGISKYVNWQGGGSFIYLELAKNNQTAKEEILTCNSLKELMQFFEVMYNKFFLHYNVRIKQFKEVISKEANFKKLSLDRQKEIFAKMLDLNQLYVNLSELEDSRYNLDKKDIALTKDFYQVK